MSNNALIFQEHQMKNLNSRAYAKTFTTRLSNDQFKHLKEMTNPSEYLRGLIMRDIQVVNHEDT
jgi:hypothetical protein